MACHHINTVTCPECDPGRGIQPLTTPVVPPPSFQGVLRQYYPDPVILDDANRDALLAFIGMVEESWDGIKSYMDGLGEMWMGDGEVRMVDAFIKSQIARIKKRAK